MTDEEEMNARHQEMMSPSVEISQTGSEGTGKFDANHKSVLEASKPNNKLTQRRIGQRLCSKCAFKDVERISICDGGASDHDCVEVTKQDNSRGAPNTIS